MDKGISGEEGVWKGVGKKTAEIPTSVDALGDRERNN